MASRQLIAVLLLSIASNVGAVESESGVSVNPIRKVVALADLVRGVLGW